MASYPSDVYGKNMTQGQARRALSRSSVTPPRATTRRSFALRNSAAVECASCATNTTDGRVVDGEWRCNKCAYRLADD